MENSVYLPAVSGLLHAYADTFPDLKENYEFQPYIYYRDKIENIITKFDNPDVVAFSSSMWNINLSLAVAKEVKNKYPKCLIIFGGCETPWKAEKFFDDNPFIDVTVRGEGEQPFVSILKRNIISRDFSNIPSISYRSLETGKCIRNEGDSPRQKNLDIYPCAYDGGYFDNLLKEKTIEFQTIVESNRGCPYACSFCMSAESLILFEDRIVRLKNEKCEEDITCVHGDNHIHKLSQDGRIMYQGKKECIRLSLSNGINVDITPDHKMLFIDNDEIKTKIAGEIKINDWLPVKVGQNNAIEEVKVPNINLFNKKGSLLKGKVPETVNEELAWMMGLLIGDGNLRKSGRAVRYAIGPILEEKVKKLSRELFDIEPCSFSPGNTDKIKHVEIHSTLVVRIFESLDILRNKAKLKVPEPIFHSPANVVRSFLKGLWDADGYTPKDATSPYLTTISWKLAEEVSTLIHWIGDGAKIYKVDSKRYQPNVKHNVNNVYRVEWMSREKREFDNHKGAIGVANQIPLSFGLTPDLKVGPNIGFNGRKRGVVPRARLRRFDPNHSLLANDLLFVQVLSITNIGLQDVYDVITQPQNRTTVNGVWVNQCFWGSGEAQQKYNLFGMERIKKTVEWCAKNNIKYVFCADANFGIFERDYQIAQWLVDLKKQYSSPEKFRVCYAKNQGETVFKIGKLLADNKLEKGVTMALQSNDQQTLVNVGRKNIKLSTYNEIQKRCSEADIPTYTELIFGLPGETYKSFVDGIEKTLEASVLCQVFVYLCQILTNTEMAQEEYIEKHKIKTSSVPLSEIHTVPREEGIITEYEKLIISTSSLSIEDWRNGTVMMWVMQLFHGLKLCFNIQTYMRHRFGVKYTDFFEYVIHKNSHKYPIIKEEIDQLYNIADGILNGKERGQLLPEFSKIFWEPEEAIYLRISTKKDIFFEELHNIVIDYLNDNGIIFDKEELKEVIKYQKERVPTLNASQNEEVQFSYNIPKYFDKLFLENKVDIIKQPQIMKLTNYKNYDNDKKLFAKEIVLWGRKSNGMMFRCEWRNK